MLFRSVVARQLLRRYLLKAKFFALGLLLAHRLRQFQAEFLDLRRRGVRRDWGGERILRWIGAGGHVSRGVAIGAIAEVGGVLRPGVEFEDSEDGGVLEVSRDRLDGLQRSIHLPQPYVFCLLDKIC